MKTAKNYSPKTRIVSLVLCFLVIFYVFPTSFFAEEFYKDTAVFDSPVSKNKENNTNDPGIYEVTELREENVKHFRLEDGSYIAAQYNYPIHYTDENGKLEDIDNRLIESGSDFATNNSRVKFIKKITGNGNIFTIHENNTKIAMGLVGAEKKTKGVVTSTNNSDDDIKDVLGKLTNLENISSTILYEDILDGVDIEYVIHSLDIKENIIVKERKESYTYTFTLELNNLTATMMNDGSVHINDYDGIMQYIIPAPTVIDSNGAYAPSSASWYVLTSVGNGKYEISVTVESSWMNSADRAFPVTIDPPMEGSGRCLMDLSIDSSSPNTNSAGDESFYVSSTERAYIRFNSDYLADVPLGAFIAKAELNILGSKSPLCEDAIVGAYAITTDWDITLNWNKTVSSTPEGSFSNELLDYTTIGTTNQEHKWNITELYKAWLGGKDNYGVGLRLVDEAASDQSALFTSIWYTPPGDETNYYDPVVMVTYVYTDGLESYYPTVTHSAGMGGTGSINLSTGKLNLLIPTLTTTDRLFSFTPTLVYNGSLAGKYATSENISTAFAESYMPKGFKLNIQETIVKTSYSPRDGGSIYYYMLYDADGTMHPFYRDYPTQTFYDDDGLQLTMTVGTNEITVKDVDNNIKTYSKINNSSWHLTSIADKFGNELVFQFNESYQPVSVIVKPNELQDIVMLNLLYEGDKLTKVYNSASKDSVEFEYLNGYLSCVNYYCGNPNTSDHNASLFASAIYEYDSVGNITRITSTDTNISLQYEITNGKITKISEYAGSTLGQQVSYSYGEGYTDVRSTGNDETLDTLDDVITRYVFDSYGRAVSVYSMSSDGTEIYGATAGTYETQEKVKNNLEKQITIGGSAVNYILNGGFENQMQYWIVNGEAYVQEESNFEGEGRYCLSVTPKENQLASAKQKLKLRNGSYTLSALIHSKKCENYTGVAKIVYSDTSVVLHSEEIPLVTESYFGEVTYFTTSFEIDSPNEFTEVEVVMEFTTVEENPDTKIRIDRVMLDNHIGSADYSLIKYGSFDTTTLNASNSEYSLQSMWGSGSTIVSSDSPFDNVLKLTSSGVSSESAIKQRVFLATLNDYNNFDNLYGQGNNNAYEYIVSGFAKSENALSNENSKFRLVVEIVYYQGKNKDDVTFTYEFDFLPGCDEWQFICGHVPTVPPNNNSNNYDCIKYIDVICEYSGQPEGYALFDNISLIYATGDNLAKNYYNDKGLLVAVESYGLEEYYHYTDNNCVSKIINNQNEYVEYKYEHSNPVLVTSINKYTYQWNEPTYEGYYLSPQFDDIVTKTKISSTEYTYDSFGLCTSMKQMQCDSAGNMLSEYIGEEYYYITDNNSKIFGALDYSIDSLNKRTSYVYDNNNGLLLLTGYSDHTAVAYSYDNLGRMTKASPAYYSYVNNYQTVLGYSDVEYTYNESNLLEKIITDSTEYTISYNTYNVDSGISIGDRTLATYEYYPNNGKLKKINYGNGFSEEYVYNTLEMLSEVWYTDNEGNRILAYEYGYTSYGQLNKITDHISEKNIVYRYDINDRLILSGVYNDGEYELLTEYSYDDLSRISSSQSHIRYYVGGVERNSYLNYSYSYNNDGSLSSLNALNAVLSYSYDNFKRLSDKTIEYKDYGSTPTYTNQVVYGYKSISDLYSYYIDEYISRVNGAESERFTYEYSDTGNITKITDKNGDEIRYYYGMLNNLSTVEDEITNKKYVYRYDDAGNVTSIETSFLSSSSGGGGDIGTLRALLPPLIPPSGTTITLSYTNSEWGDLLTSYDGTAITYDAIGNPLSYYNGSAYTFAWEGRRLVGAVQGSKTMSFTYNDEGLRTSKTVNGATITYLYDGTRLIAEYAPTYTCVYIYDESGSIIGARYISTAENSTWQTYFFEKNLQGDVIAVYSGTGTKLISYRYDAWGNTTTTYSNGGSSTLAANNSITYRGYYFDKDLGMYYLQSRYYDAKICRFINADGYVSTGQGLTGYNMFAYCGNNPVTRIDPTGEAWFLPIIVVVATAILIGHVAAGINKIAANKTVEELEKNNSESGSPVSNEVLINNYLSEKYGKDSEIYVKITADNAHIHNGSDVNFRDRMVVSMLLSKNGYSQRRTFNLAAEWEAHNIVDFILCGTNTNARHVDLDSNFYDNKWYTELGTILCHIIGWY